MNTEFKKLFTILIIVLAFTIATNIKQFSIVQEIENINETQHLILKECSKEHTDYLLNQTRIEHSEHLWYLKDISKKQRVIIQ